MKKRYEELDALRGVAALLVLFFHFTLKREEANWGFKLGTTGVDLFFIISGFVIFYSLENIKNYKQFIANRISRLYPTYWAAVTLTFIMMVAYSILTSNWEKVSLVQYIGNMTMFQFYMGIPDLDDPYWTMIIEMLFYIVMIILYQWRGLKWIDYIFGVVIVATIGMTQLAQGQDWMRNTLHYFPLIQFLPLFYAGTLFYRLKLLDTINYMFVLLIILCFASQVYMFNYAGRSRAFIDHDEYAYMLMVFFILFFLFVYNKLEFIVSKPTLFLGKISFALYLIHQKISLGFVIPTLHDQLKLNFWISAVAALIVSIGLATFITYFIELRYSKKMKIILYRLFRLD